MTPIERTKAIRTLLGVTADGDFRQLSRAALDKLIAQANAGPQEHYGMASSFADPADIAAFKRCKAKGKSDMECFKVGDNGIGVWGDDTTVDKPYCALPRDVWAPLGNAARGAKVNVTINGKTVVCELRDTMPHTKNLKNKAIIDLAPGAQKAFGLKAPFHGAREVVMGMKIQRAKSRNHLTINAT